MPNPASSLCLCMLSMTSYDMKYHFSYLGPAVLHLQSFHWWSNVRKRKKALILFKRCIVVTKHSSSINTVFVTNLKHSNLKAAIRILTLFLPNPVRSLPLILKIYITLRSDVVQYPLINHPFSLLTL